MKAKFLLASTNRQNCNFQEPVQSMANAEATSSRRVKKRRVQRSPVANLQAFPALPPGHIHDPGRHSMAMDVAVLQPELRALLARFRGHLVAHRVQPW